MTEPAGGLWSSKSLSDRAHLNEWVPILWPWPWVDVINRLFTFLHIYALLIKIRKASARGWSWTWPGLGRLSIWHTKILNLYRPIIYITKKAKTSQKVWSCDQWIIHAKKIVYLFSLSNFQYASANQLTIYTYTFPGRWFQRRSPVTTIQAEITRHRRKPAFSGRIANAKPSPTWCIYTAFR